MTDPYIRARNLTESADMLVGTGSSYFGQCKISRNEDRGVGDLFIGGSIVTTDGITKEADFTTDLSGGYIGMAMGEETIFFYKYVLAGSIILYSKIIGGSYIASSEYCTDNYCRLVSVKFVGSDATKEYYVLYWLEAFAMSGYDWILHVETISITIADGTITDEADHAYVPDYDNLGWAGVDGDYIYLWVLQGATYSIYKIDWTDCSHNDNWTTTYQPAWILDGIGWVDSTKAKISTDLGVTWTDTPYESSDFATDTVSDGTYLYYYDDTNDVIKRGTISSTAITWENWIPCPIGSGLTYEGFDTFNGDFVVCVSNASHECFYMTFVKDVLELTIFGAIISREIMGGISYADLQLNDSEIVQNVAGILDVYDANDVLRFSGYALPSNDLYSIRLEGVDRILQNDTVNKVYSAQTPTQIAEDLVVDGFMGINDDDLASATTYNQTWGASVPRHIAIDTVCNVENAYWRTKIYDVDIYLFSAPNASGKTLTWGTTTAELISQQNAITDPINKLVVYGGYSSTGVLQITKSIGQGDNPLVLRRNDILSYDLLEKFVDELWDQRKLVSAMPKVYTIAVWGNVWIDCGDSITIAGGDNVYPTMDNGSYIVLKTEFNLFTGKLEMDISQSISSYIKDYNNLIPYTSQVGVTTTDSTSGDVVDQTSLAEVLGQIQDILDRLDALEA